VLRRPKLCVLLVFYRVTPSPYWWTLGAPIHSLVANWVPHCPTFSSYNLSWQYKLLTVRYYTVISIFQQAVWLVQGCSFTTDLKLLPLQSYDMILGLDWLSSFSPMQNHWQQKWIAIPYDGATVVLIGDALDLPVGSVL
jgi:hypothetical protein